MGKAGTTSLIILQKLGALGSELRGRKIAISLSASSFLTPALKPEFYAGNFSLPAASGTLFGNALDFKLEERDRKANASVPRHARKRWITAARCQLPCFRPSTGPHHSHGHLAIGKTAKHQYSICKTTSKRSFTFWPEASRSQIGYDRSIRTRCALRKAFDADNQQTESFDTIWPARDAAFRARITAASEWTDLELLFRTLAELKAEPLILSMPIDAYAARGVSPSAREVYYERMRELAQRYHFPVIEFEQHDADPAFLIARREHPTPRGWMVYNRALDDFFRKTKWRISKTTSN